jgi:FtsZ-binding cell division protein ZapB
MKDITVPYEVLIRWDRQGRIQGAHYQERRVVEEGAEVLLDRPLDPIPLELAEKAAGKNLKEVLGKACDAALRDAGTLREEVRQLKDHAARLDKERKDAEASAEAYAKEADRLNKNLEASKAEAEALRRELDQNRLAVTSLGETVRRLTGTVQK